MRDGHMWCEYCELDYQERLLDIADEQRKREAEKQLSVGSMKVRLEEAGIPYEVDENGHAIVKWWSF